jgi:hypothetical protein
MATSMLFMGLILLNRYYENKTKEHLLDFQKEWEQLEKKYET